MEAEKCIVKNCGTSKRNLFCSPSDQKTLKIWQKIVGTKEHFFLICEKHFAVKDILIEMSLESTACPTFNTKDTKINVDGDLCGMCLTNLDENDKITIYKQEVDYFAEVTTFKPVKDYICESCNDFIENYHKFKTVIKEKHKTLRKQDKSESEEDCMVVSDCKPAVPNKYPKLPPEIISRLKVIENPKGAKTSFTCKHCYFKASESKTLNDHIDLTHYFPCKSCPFISSNSPLLTLHGNKIHPGNEDTILCGICDTTFDDKNEIEAHYDRAHSMQTSSYFMCFYCKTSCSSGEELIKHYKELHTDCATTAKHQINNTKLQLALLLGNKERLSNKSKRESYNEIMNRLKSSVTVKKIVNTSRVKKKFTQMRYNDLLPINTMIKIPQPQPVPKQKITEVTIVSNKSSQQYQPELNSSDEEMRDDSAGVFDDSDDEPLAKIMDSTKSSPPKKVETIRAGTSTQNVSEDIFTTTFRCFNCNQYFEDIGKLLAHREKAHPPLQKKYDVFDLTKIPADPHKFERKKVVIEGSSDKIICEICSVLVQERNMQRHIERVHTDCQLLCHYCSKTFREQFSFKYHMMTHEPDSLFRCDMCNKAWVTKGKLVRHITRTHLKIPHIVAQCPVCNKKLSKSKKCANVLDAHMKKYHENGKDDGYRVNQETNYYDCEKCGASYWDLYTFTRHSCERGRLQLRCLDCMIPCGNQESLAKHKQTKCRKLNPFINSGKVKEIQVVPKVRPMEFEFTPNF